MQILTINTRRFHIPQSWEEVPLEQRLAYWLIINDELNATVARSEETWLIRLRLLLLTTDQSIDFEGWKTSAGDQYDWEVEQVVRLFDWIYTQEEDDDGHILLSISPTMDAVPVPPIELHLLDGTPTVWSLPDAGMKNITFGELIKVFTCVETFAEGDKTQLDELVVVICRPERQGLYADTRIPYVGYEFLTGERLKLTFQVHPSVKEFIMFWAQCIHYYYTSSYANLFSAADKEAERVGNDYRWAGLVMALSSDVTKIPEVMNQPGEDVFVYLSYMEDERKRQDREMKKLS